MNRKLQRKVSIVFALTMAIMIALLLVCMITEARTTTGLMGSTEEGQYFSTDLGYFTVHGKTYYAHHSRSAMYKKGELLTNGYRVRNGKMYYFGPDGAMITRKTSRNRTTRYIDFNKDGSVHYIYPAGRGEKYERYNANRQRFQEYKDGKWRDTGMQVWPYGWIDWQW